jgi:hypothetical protein
MVAFDVEKLVMCLNGPLFALFISNLATRYRRTILTLLRLTPLPTCSLEKNLSMLGPIFSYEGTVV